MGDRGDGGGEEREGRSRGARGRDKIGGEERDGRGMGDRGERGGERK